MILYDIIWYHMIFYDMILYDIIWYFMIFYDILWYFMILYDIIWYYMILYDIIWYYMIFYDILWYCMILYNILWYYMILYDIIWYFMIWYDIIWYDIIWCERIPTYGGDIHACNLYPMRIPTAPPGKTREMGGTATNLLLFRGCSTISSHHRCKNRCEPGNVASLGIGAMRASHILRQRKPRDLTTRIRAVRAVLLEVQTSPICKWFFWKFKHHLLCLDIYDIWYKSWWMEVDS